MAEAILLNQLKYDQRRICGQLVSMPSAWWVEMDEEDEATAMSLYPFGLVERLCPLHTEAILFRATDRGRYYWKQFTDAEKQKHFLGAKT